jgi:hypothetical protein
VLVAHTQAGEDTRARLQLQHLVEEEKGRPVREDRLDLLPRERSDDLAPLAGDGSRRAEPGSADA